jgi:hypothetical protein
MSKKLTIDFYQVLTNSSLSSISSFDDILQKLASLPTNQRTKLIRLHPVYLYEIQCGWQDTWEGEIVQLRMDNIPVKGNLSGDIEDFQLSTDEGIGEQSAFIYHPGSKILALQTNRHGVSPGNFAQYFESIAEGDTEIALIPVLQIDAMQRLENMKDVTKMEINVAGLSNMSLFNTGDDGLQEIIELTNFYESPSVCIEMKASPRRSEPSFLSKEKVINTAQTLLRVSNTKQSNTKVKQIRITGKSDEEDNIFVDLLKDKMREHVQVNSSSRNRNIPYVDRKIALQNAWNKRLSEISRMYMN